MWKASALAIEPERNVLPLTMKQRLILPNQIPQGAARDVEPTAAESRFRKIVVVGMEHTIRVVHAGIHCRIDPALLIEQLIVGVSLREVIPGICVVDLGERHEAVAGTVA